MQSLIDIVLERRGGAASRAQFLGAGLSRHVLDSEIKQGALVRVMPRVYCRPWNEDVVEIRERAALWSVGMPVALSHLSSLRSWGLLKEPEQIHATVPARRCISSTQRLVVHRADPFPAVVRHNGLVTVAPAEAVAQAWPLLAGPDQREPAITAIRSRLISPDDLRESIARRSRLGGRRELAQLADLLAAGCESELEIWGYREVFDVPGLDQAVRQRAVWVGGRRYRLDLAYEEELVGVELDGDRYHSTFEQRERDRRKDAALASVGWLILRYTHWRLHADVAGCRRDTLSTLAARRRR